MTQTGAVLPSVDSALAEYQESSKVPDFDCPTCKVRRTAFSMILPHETPRVLVIQLKRFTLSGMAVEKLDHLVEFHHRFELPNSYGSTQHYELFAVVYHSGSPFGGHYYSAIKSEGQWFIANDGDIIRLPGEPPQQGAYMLFYSDVNAPVSEDSQEAAETPATEAAATPAAEPSTLAPSIVLGDLPELPGEGFDEWVELGRTSDTAYSFEPFAPEIPNEDGSDFPYYF